MANIEYGLLKLAAAKASGMAFPMGLVAVAAIWVWSTRDRHSVALPQNDSSATGSKEEADPGASPREAGSTTSTARQRASYRSASDAPFGGGGDREALLSQILEDNIRLRESLQ